MSNNNEGAPTPDSIEAKALAELEKEGHIIEGKPEGKPDDKSVELSKKEEDKNKKEDNKIDRTPSMVEAWKLKVAEDQKQSLAKQVEDLQVKLKEISEQKGPVSKSQKEEINEDVETIIKEAEAKGTDGDFLRKFANSILNKAKPSSEIEKTLQSIQEEREVEKQLNAYQQEFEKDIIPLVKEYKLSDTALLQLRDQLKELAFSETYAKVPLKEIFDIKKNNFDFKESKRSSESKSFKQRASDIVDIDNLDEDAFKNFSSEQVEKFIASKSSIGVWKSNKK
jgi:hypothetical protein